MTSRIVLVGDVRRWAADELAAHCEVVRSESRVEIVVDMSNVRSCDAPGLDVLLALHMGDPVSGVVFEGARWSQFFDLFVASSMEDLGLWRHQVRQLVWSSRRVRRTEWFTGREPDARSAD